MGESMQKKNKKEILCVKNLSIQFGGLKAVDRLSFSVNEGEIYGLIGPNGAGKTTVFNCITQFYTPDTGDILFRTKEGKVENLTHVKVHNIIKKGLVRTFQNVELVQELSVLDNVLIGGHIDFQATLPELFLRLPRAKKEEREIRKKAEGVLEFLVIQDFKNELVKGQPYGIRKKVEMARTLMAEPKLIILDEPAAGLNDTETLQLAETIRRIQQAYACTILLVEHDMGLVMRICHRICVLSFGKLLAVGTPGEIQSNALVQEAYLGQKEA